MLAKIIVLLVLGAIVASLGSALYYLLKDVDRRSPRTVKALTLRIGLSIALFFSLLLGYRLGFLHPHGLKPNSQAPLVPPGKAASTVGWHPENASEKRRRTAGGRIS